MIGYQDWETLRVFRRSAVIAYDDADVSHGWLDKTNFVRIRILLLTNKSAFFFIVRCPGELVRFRRP